MRQLVLVLISALSVRAAAPMRIIDFETLPNHSPTPLGVADGWHRWGVRFDNATPWPQYPYNANSMGCTLYPQFDAPSGTNCIAPSGGPLEISFLTHAKRAGFVTNLTFTIVTTICYPEFYSPDVTVYDLHGQPHPVILQQSSYGSSATGRAIRNNIVSLSESNGISRVSISKNFNDYYMIDDVTFGRVGDVKRALRRQHLRR